MRLLVTGSRTWTRAELLSSTLHRVTRDWEQVTLIHGNCPTGADMLAHLYATAAGWWVEPWPARWSRDGRAAGPLRNQAMVNSGADLCVAFLQPGSRGTRDCIRRARKAGIPVEVVS